MHLAGSDTEARKRLQHVLQMMDLGLTPTTPPRICRYVQQVQKSQGPEAQNAIKQLFSLGREKTVKALIADADVKNGHQERILQEVLTALRSTQTQLVEPGFCFDLLPIIAAQPDESARDRLLSVLMSVREVSQSMSREKWVMAFTDMVVKDKSSLVRRRLIGRVYSNTAIISLLVKKERLHIWIDAIASSQEKNRRGTYLRQIVSSTTIKANFSKDKGLIRLIDRVSLDAREMMLMQLTTKKDLHKFLFDQVEAKDLQQMYLEVADVESRHTLVGRLVAMPFWYKDHQDRAAKILDKEYTDKERRLLFSGIMEGWAQIGSAERGLIDQKFVSRIWDELTTERAAWQLHPLLLTYGLPDLFKDRFNSTTVDQLLDIGNELGETTAAVLAQAPTRYPELAKQLKKQKRILDFMQCLRRSSPQVWRKYASNLYRNDNVAGALTDPKERQKLLDFLADEDESTRYTHLTGVIDNRTLLPKLINEDKKYDRIVKLFPGKRLSYQRAQLLGRLLGKPDVVNFLIKEKRFDDLMVFAKEGQTANDKQLILSNLLNSDAAVKAIIDSGRLQILNEAIASCDKRYAQSLHQKLIVRPAYLEIIIKEGNVGALLAKLAKQSSSEQSRTALKLAEQLEEKDLKKEPRIALAFWEIATKPKSSYYEQRLAQKLLTLKWFRKQVIEVNKRDDGFTRLVQRATPTHLQRVLTSTITRTLITDLIKEDQLSFLESLCLGLSEQHQKSTLFQAGHSSDLRDWITQEGNLDVFAKQVGALRNANLKITLAACVLCNSSIVKNENKELIGKHLLELGDKSEPEQAARLCVYMLGNSLLRKPALDSPMMAQLLKMLEPGEASPEFISELATQYSAISSLSNLGHARKIVDALLLVRVPQIRPSALQNLLAVSTLERQLTDDEAKLVIDELLGNPKAKAQMTSLMGSNSMTRFIKLGYFGKIYKFAKQNSNAKSNSPVIWQLLMNAAVVKKMRADGKNVDELFEVMNAGNRYRLRYCLQSLMTSEAIKWVLEHHEWKKLGDIIQRMPTNDQEQVYMSMVNSSSLHDMFTEKRDLAPLNQAVSSIRPMYNYRSSLISMLSQRSKFRDAIVEPDFANQFAKLVQDEPNEQQRKQITSNLLRNSSLMAKIKTGKSNDLTKLIEAAK